MENLYLAHHGVNGQKWGVQNGPPYPLDSKVSTGHSLRKVKRLETKNVRLEKKLDKSKAREDKYKRKTPAHYLTTFGQAKQEKMIRKAAIEEGRQARIQRKLTKNRNKIERLKSEKPSEFIEKRGSLKLTAFLGTPLANVKVEATTERKKKPVKKR